ncbi:MFS transporter [Streptomyces sp. NPDC088923]|uniref:MFS transporter n=1 Tax=Streptomyces sp. NPDC088923 TaxID=3365913 RepID=UPI0037F661D2
MAAPERTGPGPRQHLTDRPIPARVPREPRGRLSTLRIPAFRLFLGAQFASALGDFMVAPALAFAVLDLTGSPGDLGLVLAARAVPVVVFMLLGGVLADRLPRHRVMIAADVARVLGQGTAAVLVLTGSAAVWQLVVLQAVHGTASALFTPAVTGLVRDTVPPPARQGANALRGMSQSAAMIGGPLLGTLLVLTAGTGWAIAADATTFAVSAACLALLRAPCSIRPPAPARPLWSDLREGWREFSSRPWVWSMIVMASLTNMLYAVFTVLGPVLSERELGGRGAWGLLLTAFGAGAICGGAAALWVRPVRPLRAGLLAVALFAAPPLVLSQAGSPLPAALAVFLGGCGLMLFNPLWETVLQAGVPAAALSRVSAYEWFGSCAAQPLGLALAGPLAAHAGLRTTLLATGLGQLLISLAPLALREVREYPAPDQGTATEGNLQ